MFIVGKINLYFAYFAWLKQVKLSPYFAYFALFIVGKISLYFALLCPSNDEENAKTNSTDLSLLCLLCPYFAYFVHTLPTMHFTHTKARLFAKNQLSNKEKIKRFLQGMSVHQKLSLVFFLQEMVAKFLFYL